MHPAGPAGDLLLWRTEVSPPTCRRLRLPPAPPPSRPSLVKPKRPLSADLAPLPGDRRPGAELQRGHPCSARRCCRCCTCRRTPSAGSRWLRLVAIGIGLIFPRFEQLLERPFSRIPQKQITTRGNGFRARPGAGSALRSVCGSGAGRDCRGRSHRDHRRENRRAHRRIRGRRRPTAAVLRAGRPTGGGPGERVSASSARDPNRRGNRDDPARGGAGVRSPGRAAAGHSRLHRHAATEVGGAEQIREKLNLGGIVNDQNAQLSNCTNGAAQLENCGPAPDIKGIAAWLNTPDGKPIDLNSLRGKVVLIDFWAYSCINCQRAIPHVVGWYRAYKDSGFEVIGVHTPEYAFEKVTDNVRPAPPIWASRIRLRWTTTTPRGRTTATGTGRPST